MDAFEALADPVRRDLLVRLAAGPHRVVDLAEAHPISRPAVSRHLRVLGEAGLVRGIHRGRERHYELVREGLDPILGYVAGLTHPVVSAQAWDALDTEVARTVRDQRTTSPDPLEETA